MKWCICRSKDSLGKRVFSFYRRIFLNLVVLTSIFSLLGLFSFSTSISFCWLAMSLAVFSTSLITSFHFFMLFSLASLLQPQPLLFTVFQDFSPLPYLFPHFSSQPPSLLNFTSSLFIFIFCFASCHWLFFNSLSTLCSFLSSCLPLILLFFFLTPSYLVH